MQPRTRGSRRCSGSESGAALIPETDEIKGRDPSAKTITEVMVDAHPDWTDEQVAARINRECTSPVFTVEEVAR